jgi:carbonic anhydrase
MVKEEQPALHEELEKLRIEIVDQRQVNELCVTYDLEERFRTAQKSSAEIKVLWELMKEGKVEDYRMDEHVHSPTAPIGRAAYRLQSSLTTTAIKRVFRWLLLKPSMGGSAEFL